MHYRFSKYLKKFLVKIQNLKKILFVSNYLKSQNIWKTELQKNVLVIIFA